MFSENTNRQTKAEFVTTEELMPANHLLRKLDAVIDFSFINEICRPYYCADNGRPAIEPEILFKMLFIGYLFGIRSERRLVSEVQVNVAYRWFLGYGLTDSIPDASVIWQNRRRRFSGTEVAQSIFDEIVRQAIDAGLVGGEVLFSDSTHLKANANKRRFTEAEVTLSTANYLGDLDADVDEDRECHGKKPLDRDRDDPPPPARTIKRSVTDPDSGFMHRDGKPRGFFYLDHRTVDSRASIITDAFVTPGNVNDTVPYIERLTTQIAKFGFSVSAVGLDAGYNTTGICRQLQKLGIQGALGRRRGCYAKDRWGKHRYEFYPGEDAYVCPEGFALHYVTTDRKGYRHYRGQRERCECCAQKGKCLSPAQRVKTIHRHIWEDDKDRCRDFTRTEEGREIYARRKETVERSFADSKELHGLRYARMRGVARVMEQCLLTAAAQNMKKMALTLTRA
ncbi:MAG: IS1182 family transposase [Actinomycetota bacterium]|nr:IS1182 family transposase [Actinomycetota bacterium]